MSFALTTRQMIDRSKTVTRRLGWASLRPGELIQAIEKGQGLKKGEAVRRLAVLRIVDVRNERLDTMRYADPQKVAGELRAEGVSHRCETWDQFLRLHFWPQGAKPDTFVNRIEFEYVTTRERFSRLVDADSGEVLR